VFRAGHRASLCRWIVDVVGQHRSGSRPGWWPGHDVG
jgi:hypothetical protein